MRIHIRSLQWLAGLLAVLAVIAAQADEDKSALSRVEEKGVIEVAVYENFPPYSYRQNGRATGVDVDVARALERSLLRRIRK